MYQNIAVYFMKMYINIHLHEIQILFIYLFIYLSIYLFINVTSASVRQIYNMATFVFL